MCMVKISCSPLDKRMPYGQWHGNTQMLHDKIMIVAINGRKRRNCLKVQIFWTLFPLLFSNIPWGRKDYENCDKISARFLLKCFQISNFFKLVSIGQNVFPFVVRMQ